MIKAFILWARRRTRQSERVRVVTFDDKFLFRRHQFLWPDEWPDSWYDRHLDLCAARGDPPLKKPNRPPWWRPFNAMLHCWGATADTKEGFHDHPRWTVTVCLRGRLVEMTPWGERELRPGTVVFRSRKAIHAFRVPEGYAGKTWTLFIVGRRNHRQNTYAITPR